jgi:predicted SAM-dependent methyltransferase
LTDKKPQKVHMGCGKRNFGFDWFHVDGNESGDIIYDHINSTDIQLRFFKDDSVDLIYASHFLEYFDREEVVPLLRNWHRVLKTNGILRLAVPDFETMAMLYYTDQYPLSNFLGPLYGKIEYNDEHAYHKTVYDFRSLSELLTSAGYKNVRLYDWRETEHAGFDDHSQAYLPHMDKDDGTLISLNVECSK